MNALSRYIPHWPDSHLLASIGKQVNTHTQAALERLAYGNVLRTVSHQLNHCEHCLGHSRINLTLVVAEKLHLRSRLAEHGSLVGHTLQQQYDQLHDVEQNLVRHLRQGARQLDEARRTLSQIKSAPFAGRLAHHERLETLLDEVHAIHEQQQELTGQLRGLLDSAVEPRLRRSLGLYRPMATLTTGLLACLKYWRAA